MHRIRQFREKSGFSQTELAGKVGVSLDTVHRWEAGKRDPRLPDLLKLAELFACSLDDLANPQSSPGSQEDR